MSPSEFNTKIGNALYVVGGWTTSGQRTAHHNADVGGIWDSLHQVDMAKDCIVPLMNEPMSTLHAKWIPANLPGGKDRTIGDLFVKLCSRMGLLALDEVDHYHVQPKRP